MRISDWSSDVCSSDLGSPAGIPAVDIAIGVDAPVSLDPPSNFGSIVTDALARYTQGDEVDVNVVSGYPGNDLKTMSSYVYAERQNASGGWDVVATDRDPQLRFVWNSSSNLISTELNMVSASTVDLLRSEEHTSELQSLMRISYAVFCLKKKNKNQKLIQKHKQSINK